LLDFSVKAENLNLSLQTKNLAAYNTLSAWISKRRIPHAVLLEGPPDSPKAVFAAEIAKSAMCTGIERPCGECSHCRKIEKNIHPDLSFFSGEGRANSFHIETVREIRSKAHIYPNEAAVKVFVIENAQDMSLQAQNALLKILEEPPDSVAFVLTCENKSALLETVISRVSVIPLFGQADEAAEPDEKAAAVQMDAVNIANALLAAKEAEAMACFAKYERDRTGFLQLMAAFRHIIEKKLLTPESEAEKGIAPLRLMQIIDIIDETVYSAGGNANLSLLGCVICARIRKSLSA